MFRAPRPLATHDDRASFDCGRESLNLWLRRHAWNNHVSGASRVNVVEEATTGRIAGFVAMSASSIERALMPKSRQRRQPDPVPVLLLGQLAVDKDFQSRGVAQSLLFFALKSALSASDLVGCVGAVTHPLDEGVRGFYSRWGFEDLPFDPKRAMMLRIAELREAVKTGHVDPH